MPICDISWKLMTFKRYISSHLVNNLGATEVLQNRCFFDEDLDLADEDLTKIFRSTMLICKIF